MNVELIQMDPDQARESLRTYRRALHRRADTEYETVAAGLEELAAGRAVISLTAAIRGGGFDEQMRPKLAIARADRRQVMFEWPAYRRTGLFDASKSGRTEPGSTLARWVDFGRSHGWADPERQYLQTVCGYALVPMIPPAAREVSGVPASRDRDHFVLWEVEEWSDRPIGAEPPGDPLLLRHLGGDAYAVLAAWDLTPLERLAMAGRADA